MEKHYIVRADSAEDDYTFTLGCTFIISDGVREIIRKVQEGIKTIRESTNIDYGIVSVNIPNITFFSFIDGNNDSIGEDLLVELENIVEEDPKEISNVFFDELDGFELQADISQVRVYENSIIFIAHTKYGTEVYSAEISNESIEI